MYVFYIIYLLLGYLDAIAFNCNGVLLCRVFTINILSFN